MSLREQSMVRICINSDNKQCLFTTYMTAICRLKVTSIIKCIISIKLHSPIYHFLVPHTAPHRTTVRVSRRRGEEHPSFSLQMMKRGRARTQTQVEEPQQKEFRVYLQAHAFTVPYYRYHGRLVRSRNVGVVPR